MYIHYLVYLINTDFVHEHCARSLQLEVRVIRIDVMREPLHLLPGWLPSNSMEHQLMVLQNVNHQGLHEGEMPCV